MIERSAVKVYCFSKTCCLAAGFKTKTVALACPFIFPLCGQIKPPATGWAKPLFRRQRLSRTETQGDKGRHNPQLEDDGPDIQSRFILALKTARVNAGGPGKAKDAKELVFDATDDVFACPVGK